MAREKAGSKKKTSTARGAQDKFFIPNLSAALKDEYRRRKKDNSARELPPPQDSTVSYEIVSGDDEAPRDGVSAGSARKTAGAKAAAAPASTPAQKRAAAKQAIKEKAEQEAQKAKVLKELRSIIGKLDLESLSTILEEAHVALYNMEAERVNAIAEERERRNAQKAGIKLPEDRDSPTVRIDRSSTGNSYYIGYRRAYPMFDSREMLGMVRIAFGSGDERDAARAIMRWMGQERVDALNELGGPETDLFVAIVRTIKKSFRDPRERR